MSKVAEIEEKWFRKTSAAQRKWINMVKSAESLDAFCRGVADALGLNEQQVRASLPAKNWAAFQTNPERYLSSLISGVKRAYDLKKWSRGMTKAFTSPG